MHRGPDRITGPGTRVETPRRRGLRHRVAPYTRSSEGPDGGPLFDITIRADVLDKSLSEFLTDKESMPLADDGSGYTVRLSAARAPALTYPLLHGAELYKALGAVRRDHLEVPCARIP